MMRREQNLSKPQGFMGRRRELMEHPPMLAGKAKKWMHVRSHHAARQVATVYVARTEPRLVEIPAAGAGSFGIAAQGAGLVHTHIPNQGAGSFGIPTQDRS
eukprot:750589_1